MGLGCASLEYTGVFTYLEALRTTSVRDFYRGFVTWARLSIISVSSPLPFPEDGGAVRMNVPSSNHGMVFLVTGPHPGTHPVTSLEQKTLLSAGNSKGLRTSVSGTGTEANL